MRVRRLCWVGTTAAQYEPMVRLLRDVLGLGVVFEEETTTELEVSSGDRLQVFAPGHPYSAFLDEHARGPVVLFEVDDVRSARSELIAAGVEVVGEIEHDREWEWLHFRAPDGNLYELACRRQGGR